MKRYLVVISEEGCPDIESIFLSPSSNNLLISTPFLEFCLIFFHGNARMVIKDITLPELRLVEPVKHG